jgi:hypothetical protein
VSFANSKSSAQASAKASVRGSASIVIETSAGTGHGSSSKATIEDRSVRGPVDGRYWL